MNNKILSLLTATALLGGCQKTDDARTRAEAYRQACLGDHSVKCQAMKMDAGIARLEAATAIARRSKDKFVACQERPAFDQGIALFDEKMDYYKRLKPNVFMRSVLSDMQIAFKQPPFKHEAQLAAFMAELERCQKGTLALLPAH